MGGAGFEIEETAPDQILGREPENVVRGGVEVCEAALRVGCPDQVVGSFDEIAIAVFAFEEKLDDPTLFRERALHRRELLRGLLDGRAQAGSGEAIYELFGIAAVAAGSAECN